MQSIPKNASSGTKFQKISQFGVQNFYLKENIPYILYKIYRIPQYTGKIDTFSKKNRQKQKNKKNYINTKPPMVHLHRIYTMLTNVKNICLDFISIVTLHPPLRFAKSHQGCIKFVQTLPAARGTKNFQLYAKLIIRLTIYDHSRDYIRLTN